MDQAFFGIRTPVHFIQYSKELLLSNGFIELKESEEWSQQLEKFFVVRSNGSIIACKLHDTNSCRIFTSNIDYPCFKIRPNSGRIKDNCEQLNISQYGYGMWLTWMDRDLDVAGQVVIKDKSTKKTETRLFTTTQTFCTIPSLASHLTKPPKTTCNLDAETTFRPIVAFVDGSTNDDQPIDSPTLLKTIAKELHCDLSEIVNYDLSLISAEASKRIGVNDGMIASQCLSSIYQALSGLSSLISNDVTSGLNIFYGYSNENTLSSSLTGYDSNFLDNFLQRLKITAPSFKENSLIFGAVKIDAPYASPSKGVAYRNGLCGQSQTPQPVLNSFLKKLSSKGILHHSCATTYDINNGAAGLSTRLHIPALYFGCPIYGLHSIREMAFEEDLQAFSNAANSFFE